MNVSARIHFEAHTPLTHDVASPALPGGEPVAWITIGNTLLPPAEISTHDVDALERLAAECQAAANALREAQRTEAGAA